MQQPTTGPYDASAILAAFSRASDDPRAAAARLDPEPSPHREGGGRSRAGILRRVLSAGAALIVRRTGRDGATPGGPTCARTAEARGLVPRLDQPGPALASHFDFCHAADPGPELRGAFGRPPA